LGQLRDLRSFAASHATVRLLDSVEKKNEQDLFTEDSIDNTHDTVKHDIPSETHCEFFIVPENRSDGTWYKAQVQALNSLILLIPMTG